jgi:hypothetical protein
MTTSLLNECISLRKDLPEKLYDYLQSKALTIFNPIYETAKPNEAKFIVLYILCCYSEDSPLLILRRDSDEEKEAVCDYLEIPDYMRAPLFQLKQPEVRTITTQYLWQFATPLFKALKLMEIQAEDLNLAITNREYIVQPKEEEVKITLYDFKEHGKAVQQYEILIKRIDALQKQMKAQIVQAGIAEMKEFKFKREQGKPKTPKEGISLENSKLIKFGM